jgi:hypothetical protein
MRGAGADTVDGAFKDLTLMQIIGNDWHAHP